jgi:hypothetical protein
MQVITIVTILQVLTILIVLVEATEYFVSVDGDDSNPGTLQKTLETCTKSSDHVESWGHVYD